MTMEVSVTPLAQSEPSKSSSSLPGEQNRHFFFKQLILNRRLRNLIGSPSKNVGEKTEIKGDLEPQRSSSSDSRILSRDRILEASRAAGNILAKLELEKPKTTIDDSSDEDSNDPGETGHEEQDSDRDAWKRHFWLPEPIIPSAPQTPVFMINRAPRHEIPEIYFKSAPSFSLLRAETPEKPDHQPTPPASMKVLGPSVSPMLNSRRWSTFAGHVPPRRTASSAGDEKPAAPHPASPSDLAAAASAAFALVNDEAENNDSRRQASEFSGPAISRTQRLLRPRGTSGGAPPSNIGQVTLSSSARSTVTSISAADLAAALADAVALESSPTRPRTSQRQVAPWSHDAQHLAPVPPTVAPPRGLAKKRHTILSFQAAMEADAELKLPGLGRSRSNSLSESGAATCTDGAKASTPCLSNSSPKKRGGRRSADMMETRVFQRKPSRAPSRGEIQQAPEKGVDLPAYPLGPNLKSHRHLAGRIKKEPELLKAILKVQDRNAGFL